MPFKELREQFPFIKKGCIYLDSAATSQKPECVIETMRAFYADAYGTVHRAVYELARDATFSYNKAREKAARFLNAPSSQEIIFTRGTTEAINLVASSFGKAFVKHRDEILIPEIEHHSNIVPWQMLCERIGAKLNIIPVTATGEISLDVLDKMITDRTRLISIAHVSNSTGTTHPIKKIAQMAHAKGACVCVDGAQAASHLPVDVQELDVDFYAFSGHKAYGPTGIGILYGKKQWLEKMPPYQGGGDMIEHVSFEKTSYQTAPLKFEAGTPMIAEVIGLGAALDFIESIGRGKIAEYEKGLLDHALAQLRGIDGLRLIGDAAERGPLISFVIEGVHHLDIGTLLDLKKIAVRTGHQCAQPAMHRFGVAGVVRVSFGMYNTIEEIDQFVTALQEVISLVRR